MGTFFLGVGWISPHKVDDGQMDNAVRIARVDARSVWLTGLVFWRAIYYISETEWPMKKLPFSRRLGFALAGLRDGWRRERSFRTQAFLGMFAVLVIVTLGAPAIWCAVVALAIALVLTAELLRHLSSYKALRLSARERISSSDSFTRNASTHRARR